ncbi:hypothetical protein GN956_G8164 [Arapaima gigas]
MRIVGLVGEAFITTAVNLMRIFVLYKITPYVNLFPEKLCHIFKYKIFQLENFVIVIYLLVGFIIDFTTKFTPNTTDKVLFGVGISSALAASLGAIFILNPLALLAFLHGIIIFGVQIGRPFRLDFVVFIWVSVIGTAILGVTKRRFLSNCSNFYLFQKIFFGIFITLQILFSLLYLDIMLENDTEHSTKLQEVTRHTSYHCV